MNCLVRYPWRDISGSQKKGIKKAEDFAVLRFEKRDIRRGEGEGVSDVSRRWQLLLPTADNVT